MRLLIALVATGFLLGCGPIVSIPGGELSGTVTAIPADWSFTDAVDTVQLETLPDDPYSVNIWCVSTPRGLMVGGSTGSGWVENARSDSRVRLRVEDKLYELHAEATEDEADIAAFVAAAGAKYEWELDEEQRATATLFRLVAR